MSKYTVIIPASGYSNRFKYPVNKIFYKIKNESVIRHTINAFLYDNDCNKIILTANEQNYNKLRQMFCLFSKILVVYGGNTRNATIRKATSYLEKNNKYVMIHDGARPYITNEIINKIKNDIFSDEYDAITMCIDVFDSLVEIKNNDINYVDRNKFKLIQTPQAFKQEILLKAFEIFKEINYTDEFSLVKKMKNASVKLIEGTRNNIKITTIDDVPIEE